MRLTPSSVNTGKIKVWKFGIWWWLLLGGGQHHYLYHPPGYQKMVDDVPHINLFKGKMRYSKLRSITRHPSKINLQTKMRVLFLKKIINDQPPTVSQKKKSRQMSIVHVFSAVSGSKKVQATNPQRLDEFEHAMPWSKNEHVKIRLSHACPSQKSNHLLRRGSSSYTLREKKPGQNRFSRTMRKSIKSRIWDPCENL